MRLLKRVTQALAIGSISICCNAQDIRMYSLPEKVSHAEPLYLDLVRDLGARKGEKELNIGADFINFKGYNEFGLLAEYEFAPINRLGLEVEADISLFKATDKTVEVPNHKLECLRFSAQYSFWVSKHYQSTLAFGYTQVIELADFKDYKHGQVITGVIYNPFFIAAKRWGTNFHSLVYMSPLVEHDFNGNSIKVNWQFNTSFHYNIAGTKHLIGIELNKEIIEEVFSITIRPQLKVKLTKALALGFVAGFPINKGGEKFSSFFRLIYEL